MNKRYITLGEVDLAARNVAISISQWCNDAFRAKRERTYDPLELDIFGVPRGGVSAMYAVGDHLHKHNIEPRYVSDPNEAHVIIDDLVDSGRTQHRYSKFGKAFFTLFEKGDVSSQLSGYLMDPKEWLVFPWEQSENGVDKSADDIVVRLLEHIGEDIKREGLHETPRRVVKAWAEWFSGYNQNVDNVVKVFSDGAEMVRGDQMVLVSPIPVYSMCEHHMAPIFGQASIAYIPNGKVVGLSKFKRLVDVFARRLQVQERLTTQLADAIEDALRPKGVGVILRCRHMCMESRGVNTPGTVTTTSAVRGAMLANPSAKQEFLELCKSTS